MDENTKQSKLDNRLEINPTDYAIKTFTPEFKEGQKYTKVPVKISGNATLKGLKIFFMRKSKKRYFYLSFWCHSESLTLPCGLFRDGVYGMKEVEEYLRPIVKACTNKDGHWIKDPKRWLEGEIEEIIKRKEEEILQKLEDEELKTEILKTIKDPGPLKNYFEKDVIIKDKEVFFSAAPKTEDLQEMIDRSKGDLEKILNTAKEERSFPFCGKVYHETTRGSVHYGYSGLVIRDEFYPKMINDPLFKGIFKSLTLFEEWVKENCIPWPNGELTKQIVMKEDVNKQQEYKRRRAYCIHNQKLEDGRHLIELSEGELGEHHQIFGYLNFNDQEINTMKRRAEKSQETMSNDLHMGRIGQGLDHSDYVAPDHSKQRELYDNSKNFEYIL